LGPRIFRRSAMKRGGIEHQGSGEIGKILGEIESLGITTKSPNFQSALREKLKPLILSKMRETKRRFLTTGELRMYQDGAEESIIDLVIDRISSNIRAGLPPLNKTDIQDIKVRAKRQTLSGNSRKAIADLGVLMYHLRNEVKYISIPVFIMQGMHDTISHPKSAHYLKEHIGDNIADRKKSKLLFLPRSGHVPVMDFDRYTVFEKSIQFINNVEKQYVKFEADLNLPAKIA